VIHITRVILTGYMPQLQYNSTLQYVNGHFVVRHFPQLQLQWQLELGLLHSAKIRRLVKEPVGRINGIQD
jgi:hypothetical protein